MLFQVISWGLYVLRLLNKCEFAQEWRQWHHVMQPAQYMTHGLLKEFI